MNYTNKRKNYNVYIHINKLNHKGYVGITRQDCEDRWKNGNGYTSQFFGSAIEKYGWDNFEHKILFTCLSKDEAITKEKEMIKQYNTIVPNGYNISNGGDTNYRDNKIICIETEEIFEDFDDVINKHNFLFHNKVSQSDIKQCCEHKKEFIKIPWRNLKYHYQYYTNNYLKDVDLIEQACRLKIFEKKASNYRKLDGIYHSKRAVCDVCGDIFLKESFSQKICSLCKKKKSSIY